MTIEMIPEQTSKMTPTEAYDMYHRVAKVVGEVVNESYVELLNQLANPWILASLDFSEPEIATFFQLLRSTKITIEFTNPMEAQQVVQDFHRVLKPKLLSLIETHSQSGPITITGKVKV
jgi:hypothetical protein